MILRKEAIKRALEFMGCNDEWVAIEVKENEDMFVVSIGKEGKPVYLMPIAVDKQSGKCSTFSMAENGNRETYRKMR